MKKLVSCMALVVLVVVAARMIHKHETRPSFPTLSSIDKRSLRDAPNDADVLSQPINGDIGKILSDLKDKARTSTVPVPPTTISPVPAGFTYLEAKSKFFSSNAIKPSPTGVLGTWILIGAADSNDKNAIGAYKPEGLIRGGCGGDAGPEGTEGTGHIFVTGASDPVSPEGAHAVSGRYVMRDFYGDKFDSRLDATDSRSVSFAGHNSVFACKSLMEEKFLFCSRRYTFDTKEIEEYQLFRRGAPEDITVKLSRRCSP